MRSPATSRPSSAFRREARSISALNHARICTLYDVGEHDGRTYLVLEYLDGQTLAAMLAKGPVPPRQALDFASKSLEGLEAAHAPGIVHRDLKPGNVMVTATGTKLLDFGLAKATAASMAKAGFQTAPASTTDATSILGTIPYMSPEQLEAKPVDAQTDIWALGTILYEMIAGKRAFEAPSQASLIASILDREPASLAAVAPLTPPFLNQVVARCLAKSPDERWADAHDLADALRGVRDSADQAPPIVPTRPASWRWPAVVGTVLVLAAAVAAILMLRTPSRRFTIVLPADKPLAPGGIMPEAADRPALAMTRDGTRLAYVAKIGDTTQICIRDMSTGTVVPLAGTEGGHSPFFSPDGAVLAFFAEGKLKKTPSAGGVVDSMADAPNPYGGTWGDDGWIYFTRQSQEGVHKIRADAVGGVEVVTASLARMPEALNPGRACLPPRGKGHTSWPGPGRAASSSRGFGARLLPTGHLVYALPGRLMASTLRYRPSGRDRRRHHTDRRSAHRAVWRGSVRIGTRRHARLRDGATANHDQLRLGGSTGTHAIRRASRGEVLQRSNLSADGTRLAFGVGRALTDG